MRCMRPTQLLFIRAIERFSVEACRVGHSVVCGVCVCCEAYCVLSPVCDVVQWHCGTHSQHGTNTHARNITVPHRTSNSTAAMCLDVIFTRVSPALRSRFPGHVDMAPSQIRGFGGPGLCGLGLWIALYSEYVCTLVYVDVDV